MAQPPKRKKQSIVGGMQKATLKEEAKFAFVRALSPKEFFDSYKLSKTTLGSGSFSTVYSTLNGKHAIKYTPNLLAQASGDPFIIELNAHNSFCHPCFLRPEAYCIVKKDPINPALPQKGGYVVMDRCLSIREAYTRKLISQEQIISDSMAGLSFLHEHGYVHGDITPRNLIYHEAKQRCMWIDFGRTRRATLHVDGQFYVSGSTNTLNYVDPWYSFHQYNDIRCEEYALFLTYREIFYGGQRYCTYGELHNVPSERPSSLSSPYEAYFASLVLVPPSQRPSLKQILDTPSNSFMIVRTYDHDQNDRCIYNMVLPTPAVDPFLITLLCWLVEFATNDLDLPAKYLLSCLHLLHATYKQFKSKPELVKRVDLWQLYGCVCLNTVLHHALDPKEVKLFHEASDVKAPLEAYEADYLDCLADLLHFTNGHTNPLTFWDYTDDDATNLAPIIYQMVYGRYEPCLLPKIMRDDDVVIQLQCDLEEGAEELQTKLACLQVCLPKKDLVLYENHITSQWFDPFPWYDNLVESQHDFICQPTRLDLGSNLETLELAWHEPLVWKNINDDNLITALGSLLYNQAELANLSREAAIKIVTTLRDLFLHHPQIRALARFYLDLFCSNHPWQKDQFEADVLCFRIFPFRNI